MRKTAIITSILFIGFVRWLIFKPHTVESKHVVGSNTPTAEQSSVQSVNTQQAPASVKKTATIPMPTTVTPKPPTTPTPVDTTTYYTSAEVSTHASTQKSCWSIVNGKVYDLTPWINQHPGGSGAIKRMCGVDGSDDFNGQHGGQSRPERELAAFYIGVLT